MAKYVISDLHGAFDEFHKLLNKINFKYDGSDSLYLLGDYGDWGRKSMETLLFVRDLDVRYDFVHCIMGNHEQMLISTIDSGYDNTELNEEAANWLFNNKGQGTWEAYCALTDEEKEELLSWLRGLQLSLEVEAGGKHYMMAHAYPYYYDMDYDVKEAARRKADALWRRLRLYEDPFAEYTGSRHYDMFICGHTITDVYYQEQRREGKLPSAMLNQSVRSRIFYGKHFIDIDCGAKCMDVDADREDVFSSAALRAQLAAICLDDGQEYYVRKNIITMPELPQKAANGAFTISMPDFKMPEIKLPSFVKQEDEK